MNCHFWLRQLHNMPKKKCSTCSPRHGECSIEKPAENFLLNARKIYKINNLLERFSPQNVSLDPSNAVLTTLPKILRQKYDSFLFKVPKYLKGKKFSKTKYYSGGRINCLLKQIFVLILHFYNT